MSKLQIANMMGKYDADKSGTLDFEEFLTYNETEASREKFNASFAYRTEKNNYY